MKRKSFKKTWVIAFFIVSIFFISNNTFSDSAKKVHLIQLDDATINPITAEYISRSIKKAYNDNAQCLIIKLDTPGGLLNSTRFIVKEILSSKIPVVVYIAPSGSRAGSAGVFITYASHIAAMAPSTNIGAAHPVQLGENSKRTRDSEWDELKNLLKQIKDNQTKETTTEKTELKEENLKQKKEVKSSDKPFSETEKIKADDDPMSSKILQDTVAFVKSLAQERNRNIEWAVKSVTESSSITDTEALELKVVEIIAKDELDLLAQLDGRVVKINENEITLQTKDVVIKKIDMDFRQRFFNVLANPNIAYFFLILGFYGLLYEVTHPGVGAPGVFGLIFLILAFFSMQTLPTNYAGLALIILGLLLFIAEAVSPGIGLLLLGGLTCLILGSLLLFDTSVPIMRVSWSLILGFATPMAVISIFILQMVFSSRKRQALGGSSGMINEKGEAQTDISPNKKGKVFVHGELWNAISEEPINKGEDVVVTSIERMILKVSKVQKGA